MAAQHFLAFDLGAESGRTILGTLTGDKLSLEELTRFPNGLISIHGHDHWDLYRLFGEMKKGLRTCIHDKGIKPLSIGIDTWGVDFALLAPDGTLLGQPYSYRDHRYDGAHEGFSKIMSLEELYRLTGIQVMQFNSLFQLFALKRDEPDLLASAGKLLFMPDVFNYLLTGVARNEYTIASTSQLLDPHSLTWQPRVFDAAGLDMSIMQEIIKPGTIIGNTDDNINGELGIEPVAVVAVGSHDTASAVATVPAKGRNWAYLSSGTWSLMGVELDQPVVSDKAAQYNFTNEGGVEGTIRFLKNIIGLWLLQECRRAWSKEKEYAYDELTALAMEAEPFAAFIDAGDPSFLHPANMPEAISYYCQKTGQQAPVDKRDFARLILESLAMKYRETFFDLGEVVSMPLDTLHIIGGGSRNRLLCQFTANALGVPVVAGPIEATAIGNILMQARAAGVIHSLEQAREVVRNSFSCDTYLPADHEVWLEQYQRYLKVTG
jgi:rhamnulokinase